jgi:hypothetical protein
VAFRPTASSAQIPLSSTANRPLKDMIVDAPSRMSGNTPVRSMSQTSSAHTVGTAEVERRNAERWHGLVSEIGAEIASPLTAALERIHALIASGKIDRAGCARCARKSSRRVRSASWGSS